MSVSQLDDLNELMKQSTQQLLDHVKGLEQYKLNYTLHIQNKTNIAQGRTNGQITGDDYILYNTQLEQIKYHTLQLQELIQSNINTLHSVNKNIHL